jgi:hypothetical protein
MNTNTNTQEIKKGDFVMVWNGSSEWVKRKVLLVQKTRWGADCYIVRKDRDNGIAYQDEVRAIKK